MVIYPLVTVGQKTLLGVSIVCIIITSVIVSLRLWAAARLRRAMDWSDVALIGAWLATTGLAISLIAGVYMVGIGWHEIPAVEYANDDLSILKTQAEFLQAMSQLWAFSISFAKLSMLAVYHRYFDVKYMKVGVKLCTAYVVVLLLVMLILESTICLPWGSQWNISAVETWCGQRQSRLFIASSAFHTLSDLVILVLPIPCIWSLQLPRKKKISLSIMFSAGIIVSFVSIIRIWTLTLADWSDVLYTEWWPMLMSIIEPSMTICLTCLPFLRPLFNKEQRTKQQRSSATAPESRSLSGGLDIEMQGAKAVRLKTPHVVSQHSLAVGGSTFDYTNGW